MLSCVTFLTPLTVVLVGLFVIQLAIGVTFAKKARDNYLLTLFILSSPLLLVGLVSAIFF